jgi:branched-chain amino acid transport system substrate-binding protein
MKRKLVGALLITLTVGSLLLAACQPTEQPPIKIGVQGPMTGDWTYEGEGFRRAVQLLADQINEQGGLLDGRQVEIIVGDDRGDRDEARRVAEHLVTAGVVAVVGSYNSDATEASATVYDAAGIVQITPSSTAIRLTEKGYRYFFRVCFLDDRQGLFAADFIVNTLGLRRVALVHDGSTYAEGLAEWTRLYLEEKGAEVVLHEAITPGQRDFGPLLSRVQESGAEALYFTAYYSEAGLLVKQMKDMELETVQFMGGNAVSNPEFVVVAGVEAAAGAIITTEPLPQDMKSAEAEKFMADYTARYEEPPTSIWTLMAADAFRVIVAAIESTDSTETTVLADYIRDLHDFPGITGPIAGYDEKGDRLGATHVAYIVDESGNFELYQPE